MHEFAIIIILIITVYKNLLAITMTSEHVQLTIVYCKLPKLGFNSFLKETLQFCHLNKDDDLDKKEEQAMDFSEAIYTEDVLTGNKSKDSNLFYADDNYFKGTLVRTNTKDPLNVSLKLYAR